MIDAFAGLLALVLYGLVGRFVYLKRWPDGMLPPSDSQSEIDRIRRLSRRRVRPVPDRSGRTSP